METGQYEHLRASVQDGDTIAAIATGLYGAALSLGGMGPYGHVGIVRSVEIDGMTRIMVVEENPGGGRYTPLRHYANSRIDVYRAPDGIDGRQASAEAVKMLDGLADYDFKDIWRLFRWGLVRAFARVFDDHMPEPVETDVTEGKGGVICSALVTSSYKRAGWTPSGPCGWPSALCKRLGEPAIRYRP